MSFDQNIESIANLTNDIILFDFNGTSKQTKKKKQNKKIKNN